MFFPRSLISLSLVSIVLLLCSCSDRVSSGRSIVVSIEPLRYFAQQVAGEDWEVCSLVPEGFSPEGYQLSAQQIVDVAQAGLVVKVGRLGFETTALEEALLTTGQKSVVDSSVGLEASAFDSHSWTSPSNAVVICQNIADGLCEIDSANAKLYSERLQRMVGSIDSLKNVLSVMLGDLPSRSFVIVHPALSQFAQEYGLHQLSIETDGKEPTPSSMAQLVRQAKKEGVEVVFVQKGFPQEGARIVAKQIGARVVEINPLDYNWQGQLLFIASSLKGGRR